LIVCRGDEVVTESCTRFGLSSSYNRNYGVSLIADGRAMLMDYPHSDRCEWRRLSTGMTIFLRKHGVSDTVLSLLTTPVPCTRQGAVSPIARSLQFIVKNVLHRHIDIPSMITRDQNYTGSYGGAGYCWNSSDGENIQLGTVDSDSHRPCEPIFLSSMLMFSFCYIC
jgi:hypothetical protein